MLNVIVVLDQLVKKKKKKTVCQFSAKVGKFAYSFRAILCALSRFSRCPVGHTDSTPHRRLHVITQEGTAMATHTSFFFSLSFLFSVFNK